MHMLSEISCCACSGTCCLSADGGSFRASNCCRAASQFQSYKTYSACDGALSSGQPDLRFAASISEYDKVCNEGWFSANVLMGIACFAADESSWQS